MAGGTGAYPNGAVAELMERAIEQGSVTPTEIAAILDCDEMPVAYEYDWTVGVERCRWPVGARKMKGNVFVISC